MDKQHFSHSESASSDSDVLRIEGRFKDDPSAAHVDVWTYESHEETSVEKDVRQTLSRIHLIGGIVAAACVLCLIIIGLYFYHQSTYVDPVKPDYSSLSPKSNTYWTDRIKIDIETARQSAGTEQVRLQRLQRFARQTMEEAMALPQSYAKAQAATSVAMVLAQQDTNITFEQSLQELGTTELIATMRSRTLVSQALMYIRLMQYPAARNIILQYYRLVLSANLKLNLPLNEESFFGAVTVLKFLDDDVGLTELFNHQRNSTAVMGVEQRMKAYRLVAGEQVRIGMLLPAQETAKQITYPIEFVRAWALILYYTARPQRIFPTEPVMLDLPAHPPKEPLTYPLLAEQTINRFLQYLTMNKDIGTQITLLQRLVGSRLMCDAEIHKIFRQCIFASEVLDEQVRQPVLKLLDNPESPAIRAALKMPLRISPAQEIDTATDDWTTTEETVLVKAADIDPEPLRIRNEEQSIRALLAIALGYQSVRRFQDADRILRQTFAAAQNIADQNIRRSLLMQIGEQQIAAGSIADAQQTFAVAAPLLKSNQKDELARLQIIARLFNDALETISAIESAALREYVCSFLLQEQIRIHDVQGAEKTFLLMPQGRTAAECRCRLSIAQGNANRKDFETLGLSFPENGNKDWEQHCIGLIRQGLFFTANQTANRIDDTQKRDGVLIRIAQEYQSLYQSFNNANDPDRIIRQSIQATIMSIVGRIGEAVNQAEILTELLAFLTSQLQSEADRLEGKQILTQAINTCRNISEPTDGAVLFTRLIIAKNILDTPTFSKDSYPLFTMESNQPAFEETNTLIEECLKLVNASPDEEQHGTACVYLARALAQVGRTRSAQTLHNHVLEVVTRITDRQKSIPMLLAMVPTLKAMNSTETIPIIYRLAINEVIREYTNKTANVDVYEWRMRDSEIEWIVRSQMEHGFVDDAVESATRLNEPMLHDRLLRSAAYIYLDQGDIFRAELEMRRLTVKHIQSEVERNIRIIKNRPRRSETQNPAP